MTTIPYLIGCSNVDDVVGVGLELQTIPLNPIGSDTFRPRNCPTKKKMAIRMIWMNSNHKDASCSLVECLWIINLTE